MVESDRKEFMRIMYKLAETFPRKLSDNLIDTYWSALKDWPIDRVKWGFRYISDTRTEDKFPTPAVMYQDILRAANLRKYNPDFDRAIGMDK